MTRLLHPDTGGSIEPNEDGTNVAVASGDPGYSSLLGGVPKDESPVGAPTDEPQDDGAPGAPQPKLTNLLGGSEPEPAPKDEKDDDAGLPASVVGYLREAGISEEEGRKLGLSSAMRLATELLDRRAESEQRRRTRENEFDDDRLDARRENEFDEPPPQRRRAAPVPAVEPDFSDIAAESPTAAKYLRSQQAVLTELQETNRRLVQTVQKLEGKFTESTKAVEQGRAQQLHRELCEGIATLKGYEESLGELPPTHLGTEHANFRANQQLYEKAVQIFQRRGGRIADSVVIAAAELFGEPSRTRDGTVETTSRSPRRNGTSPTTPSSGRALMRGKERFDNMTREEAERMIADRFKRMNTAGR